MDRFDFSIIVPTYNRPEYLQSCLHSLARQAGQVVPYEVVVVDDGSKDNLRDVVGPFQAQMNVRLLRQANRGPAAARNFGVAQARGRYIVFLDDDCRVPPDWSQTLAKYAKHLDGKVIGGHTVNVLKHNPFSVVSQLMVDCLYAYYNQDPENCRFFTSNNMLLPRKLFQDVKGFDESFTLAAGEDRDLCDRLRLSGATLQYRPDITIYHWHRLQSTSLMKQHFHYGRGALTYYRSRAARSNKVLRIESVEFYWRLLSHPFRSHTFYKALPLAVLLLATQAAHYAGFLWELFSSRGR